METKTYTCIVCPVSCRISVGEENGALKMEGQGCSRGLEFAKNEHTDPRRLLTTTVKLTGSRLRRLPVASSGEIPKAKLRDALDEVYKATVQAPVKMGQVIVPNVCGTGVDIVASRSAE